MTIGRRAFLGGILALGATALVRPKLPSWLPVIVGDGEHDDGPGLNALFRGERVNVARDIKNIVRNEAGVWLTGGRFRTSETLSLPQHIVVHRTWIGATKGFSNDAIVSLAAVGTGEFVDCVLDMSGAEGGVCGLEIVGDTAHALTMVGRVSFSTSS